MGHPCPRGGTGGGGGHVLRSDWRKIPNWESPPPWQAAQAVQRSGAGRATDGASNYEPHLAEAVVLVAAIDHLASGPRLGVWCGQPPGELPAGPAPRFGLPVGYPVPSMATPAETLAVMYATSASSARATCGRAAGPDSFDCSGLTMMAWAAGRYPLGALHRGLGPCEGTGGAPMAFASPGDLILVPGSDGTLAAPGHVGIYPGYGLVESAVYPAATNHQGELGELHGRELCRESATSPRQEMGGG